MFFYRMIECFNADRCPLCEYVDTRIDQYFQSLVYEHVNDRRFRKHFSESHGFCNHHGYQFLACNDGLAAAILYQGILHADMENVSPIRSAECPACQKTEHYTAEYLKVLKGFIADSELQEGFSRSTGYCVPHYQAIRAQLPELPDWLSRGQEAKLQELAQAVERYIEYSNFSDSTRPELTPRERIVWRRLVTTVHGYRGLEK